MENREIRGKLYTVEEITAYGKQSVSKKQKVFLILGIVFSSFGIFSLLLTLVGALEPDAEYDIISFYLVEISFIVAGAIFLILRFLKKYSFYEEGINYLIKNSPDPVGYNGQVINVLEAEREIVLSKKDNSKFLIKDNEFQIYHQGAYSKIYTADSLLEYEIQVDDEIAINVNTKTKQKKGLGRAIVGGALFGPAGAIAGAAAAKGTATSKSTQTEKVYHHYSLLLKVNDINKPSYVIELTDINVAEEINAILMILTSAKNFISEEENEPKDNNSNYIDELKKLNELKEQGIITEEEFDKKKKELLG